MLVGSLPLDVFKEHMQMCRLPLRDVVSGTVRVGWV